MRGRNGVDRYRPTHNRMPDGDFQRLVDDARERHNLSDIVGRHTDLRKRGPRELVGLCPFHSERTPSFEVNDAKGTYHCHGCGKGGDAIRFLIECEGMSFRQAIEVLTGDAFPTISDEDRARKKENDARQLAERIELARSIWCQSTPAHGTPAEVYARSRGITMTLPPTVRFVSTPRWRNAETGEVGRDHPAMACALQGADGAVIGVQCVFLQDGGQRKFTRIRPDGTIAKAKLTFGVLVGSALRLGPVAAHITITEGPEDALTLAQQMPGQSIWASCGTANMAQVALPAEIENVTLAGDNGDAGRAAVDKAAANYLAQGVGIGQRFPDPRFKDWNDQLVGKVMA